MRITAEKVYIGVGVLGSIAEILNYVEQSNTPSRVASMLENIVSPAFLNLIVNLSILFLLVVGLRKVTTQATQLEDHSNKLKELEHKFIHTPSGGIVPVRELITAAHLEEDAIVLTYPPTPDSVHLFITSMVYIPETSRGMVLKGRKIFLEDIPGDVHLATHLRTWVTERSVAVEYLRDLSEKETKD
jgi:hypothetical protein